MWYNAWYITHTTLKVYGGHPVTGVPFFMAKIAACLIIKDDSELDRLENCLNSFAKHVDHIFITATNQPYDKIKELCNKYEASFSLTSPATTPEVYTIQTDEGYYKFLCSRYPEDKLKKLGYENWKHRVEAGLKQDRAELVDKDTWLSARFSNFGAARNYNFSQVPAEYDWIFWCDTDDVVVGAENFRVAIERAEKLNIKAIFARYLYQVEIDETTGEIKNVIIEHLRERLIRNDGTYEWIAPIHETLIEKVPSGKTDFNDFMVVHLTDGAQMLNSMYRNIEILEEEVMNNPQDPRPIYYLAKAYFDTREDMFLYESVGEGLESLTMELFKDYLRKSGWPEERAQCYEYMSMLHREMNQFKQGITDLLEALREAPVFTSIYIQLALSYVIMKDWVKALHWVKLAGQVEIPKTTLVINPRDYKGMILEALFHIYVNTGKLEECEKVCEGMVEIMPSDLNKERLASVRDVKYRNTLAHWTVKLANHLYNTKQEQQLKALVNSIPLEIAGEPALINLRNQFIPIKTWAEDTIIIYCGPGFESWSPKSVSQGIGGSEEAVIYASKELAKLGWKVTVYGDPQENAGEYDGVNYVPHYEINWNDNFNILISWRQPGLFDLPVKTKKSYLWLHDIQNPMEYTPERVNKIDKVFFLSKWHRSNVPNLDESKVMYTGNGLSL
jgi:tetratricopeptide (TPR) repeat protein